MTYSLSVLILSLFTGSWQNPSLGRVDNRPTHNNFTTVAIVPVSDDVPLTAFTYELYHSLSGIGESSFLKLMGYCENPKSSIVLIDLWFSKILISQPPS